MKRQPQVLIVELGSQYTRLIERSLRELGVRSAILDSARSKAWLKANACKAVILSGGEASVNDPDAPQPPAEILYLQDREGRPMPILGICYGMQWLAKTLGGKVESCEGKSEYGQANIADVADFSFFGGSRPSAKVWMSHGDSVTELPPRFRRIASSAGGGVAMMASEEGTWIGVQFHPEVHETECGKAMLERFVFGIAGCAKDWEPSSLVAAIREATAEELGGQRAIIGFSGGVDSTTLTAILAPALRDKLRAIAIDAGHLREGEAEEIRRHAEAAGIDDLLVVDARERFIAAMGATTDAERKRQIFRNQYAEVFRECARRFGASFVLQGTLAPDQIESGRTGGAVIKSHHNVAQDFGLPSLHPIDHLFKYEVRGLAQGLGLPESVSSRQPFPGPGLFIRIVGAPVTAARLELVRWADAEVARIVRKAGIYGEISQLVVAYLGVDTVGVKGDGRVYGGSIAVRAVKTVDFMTALGLHLPGEVQSEICSCLTQNPEVVRVFFDPTNKPPATVEYE